MLSEVPTPPPHDNQIPEEKVSPKYNGLAVAGFITSLFLLFSIVTDIFVDILPYLLFGIVGLGLSIAGVIQITNKHQDYRGKGFAITGIIISAISLLLSIFVIFFGVFIEEFITHFFSTLGPIFG